MKYIRCTRAYFARERYVTAALGLGVILLGTGLTCLGFLWPRYVSIFEFSGGVLVIAGLVVIGRELGNLHIVHG